MAKKKRQRREDVGVVLPAGQTGSGFLQALLQDATATFGGALDRAAVPADKAEFKKRFADVMVRFEAARVGSPDRVAIARHMTRAMQTALGFTDGEGPVRPLVEHLREAVEGPAPALTSRALKGPVGLRAEVPLGKRTYRGAEILELGAALRAKHAMTDRALAALRWIVDHIDAQGGALDLSGHRFALMGAGAELAPTAMLLAAGATVLWIDPADAGPMLAPEAGLAGTLVTAEGARDLLREPCGAARAIRAFAGDAPVHVGMFAYAPGASRELRLAATMDAVARCLPPALVRSVSLFISPTIPAETQPETIAYARERANGKAPRWQRALALLRTMEKPGHFEDGEVAIARAIIDLQGPSYQAAQYLGKIAAAEAWALHGADLDGDGGAPVTVSANVAGITDTRSLQHPLFQAGFIGAPWFDVQIFPAATTRALNGLLVLHDLLNPQAPGAAATAFPTPREKARALLSQQVHGGTYSLPWRLQTVVQTAAVLGLVRKPGLLVPKRKRS